MQIVLTWPPHFQFASYRPVFILNNLRYYVTTPHISKFCYIGGSHCKVALYVNKSQGMAPSAEPDITGLNHTLQQLITQLQHCTSWEVPGKVPKTQNFKCLITGTAQHEDINYWYRTTQKHSAICTGVVGLASPAGRTINYHLAYFALIWQLNTLNRFIHSYNVELSNNKHTQTQKISNRNVHIQLQLRLQAICT